MAQNAETQFYSNAGRAPFTEHRIPREHGSLYARNYQGAGPAFVLMHGFPDNLDIYEHLIPPLAGAGRRVVTFDFMGFGRSDKPAAASYSFSRQRDDLRAVVDHLALEQIVPVAHDASGPAAVNFAIDHPARTASLVILNAAFANSASVQWPEMIELFATPTLHPLALAIAQSPEQFGWLLDFQRAQFRNSLSDAHQARFDAFLAPLIANTFQVQPGAGPAFMQMAADFFAELSRNSLRLPKLEALDIPVKVIWGENDPYLNVEFARDLQSHLKHGSLSLIPAGHWLQIDEPALVAAEMLS